MALVDLGRKLQQDDDYTKYFLAYNNSAGIPPSFMALVIFRWLISLIGALLNILTLFVIVRNRNTLHGNCNLLIAANVLFTALFELSVSSGLIIQISGVRFVELRTCFFIQVFPVFCRNMVITSLFALAFDRLFSVTLIVWHYKHSQHPNAYLAFLLLFCVAHALCFVGTAASVMLEMPHLMTICLSSDDTYQGSSSSSLFAINTVILVLVLLCYAVIWVCIRIRQNKVLADLSYTKRIVKCLTATALLVSGGWLSYNIVRAVFLPLLLDARQQPAQFAFAEFGFSLLPYLAMAGNAPLLFCFSKDYRQALIKTFHWVYRRRAAVDAATITPTNNIGISRAPKSTNHSTFPANNGPLTVPS